MRKHHFLFAVVLCILMVGCGKVDYEKICEDIINDESSRFFSFGIQDFDTSSRVAEVIYGTDFIEEVVKFNKAGQCLGLWWIEDGDTTLGYQCKYNEKGYLTDIYHIGALDEHSVHFEYDAKGRLIKFSNVWRDSSTTASSASTFEYAKNEVKKHVDNIYAKGEHSVLDQRTVYNHRGDVKKIIWQEKTPNAADGSIEFIDGKNSTIRFLGREKSTSRVDKNGKESGKGVVVKKFKHGDLVEEIHYDGKKCKKNILSHTTYDYGANGKLTKSEDKISSYVKTVDYDAKGNWIKKTIEENGKVETVTRKITYYN